MLIWLVSIKLLYVKMQWLFLFAYFYILKKLLEQEKLSTYCADFYEYIFCNKSFSSKTPHQQWAGTGFWFKCGEDWCKCLLILDIVFN